MIRTACVLLASVVAVGVVGCGGAATPSPTPLGSLSASPSRLALGLVTAAQYAAIHDGMTRAQVEAVMGSAGVVMAQSDVSGATSAVVEWQDQSMLHAIIIGFLNDAVISKDAVGF